MEGSGKTTVANILAGGKKLLGRIKYDKNYYDNRHLFSYGQLKDIYEGVIGPVAVDIADITVVKKWGGRFFNGHVISCYELAETLKQIVSTFSGIDYNVLLGESFRDERERKSHYSSVEKCQLSGRDILIKFSNGGVNKVDPHYWLKMTTKSIMSDIEKNKQVNPDSVQCSVISDVRAHNEIEFYRNLSTNIIHLIIYRDESELREDKEYLAYRDSATLIHNNGTIDDLEMKLSSVIMEFIN